MFNKTLQVFKTNVTLIVFMIKIKKNKIRKHTRKLCIINKLVIVKYVVICIYKDRFIFRMFYDHDITGL